MKNLEEPWILGTTPGQNSVKLCPSRVLRTGVKWCRLRHLRHGRVKELSLTLMCPRAQKPAEQGPIVPSGQNTIEKQKIKIQSESTKTNQVNQQVNQVNQNCNRFRFNPKTPHLSSGARLHDFPGSNTVLSSILL